MYTLSGLGDIELLKSKMSSFSPFEKLSFFLYYVIGGLFYNSECYTRQSVLGVDYEFITSPEIYELTGVYSVRFKENLSENLIMGIYGDASLAHYASSQFKIMNLNDLVFSGNSDMLYHFGDSILVKFPLVYEILEKGIYDELSLCLFLNDNVKSPNKKELFREFNDVEYFIHINYLNNLIDLISDSTIVYPYLDITNINYVKGLSDFPIDILSSRFEVVNIIVDDVSGISCFKSDRILKLIEEIRNNNFSNVKFKLSIEHERYLDDVFDVYEELVNLRLMLGDLLVE